MGRHHRTAGPRARARVAVYAGAVGAGVLPLLAPALATAAPAAPAAPAADAPPPTQRTPADTTSPSATPCFASAKACVDISAGKAWLTDGHGHVVYGAVPVTTGSKDQDLDTPTGTFGVMWKDKDHKSGQYDGADMKNSVFFAPGDAFHEGSLDRDSAGCVHLSPAASEKFFDYLQVYDEVQIIR